MLHAIRKIIGLAFFLYILMILARIILSWFPKWQNSPIVRFIAAATDPYLNLFRSFIPPIGGIDFSPTLAILLLVFVQWIILRLL